MKWVSSISIPANTLIMWRDFEVAVAITGFSIVNSVAEHVNVNVYIYGWLENGKPYFLISQIDPYQFQRHVTAGPFQLYASWHGWKL